MFNIMINNGVNEIPDDDIFYVIGKNGIFLKKNLGMIESLVPVSKIPFLENVECFAVMHIEKIPADLVGNVYEFFKEVYEKYKSEAMVLIFYNQNTKKYKFIAPSQTVSGASCNYNKGITIKNMAMIGTIHSHGSMSAFHSGTDVNDEKVFDGLHITIGNVNDEFPTISTSVVSNGHRDLVDSRYYLLGIEKVEKERKINTVYSTTVTNDKRYKILIPKEKRKFNKKWLEMVEPISYQYKHTGVYNYNFYNLQQQKINKLWENDYNTTGQVDKKEEKDPCLTCKHRKDDAWDIYDSTITYQCSKCNNVFELYIDEITQCPKCLSVSGIVEIEETTELEDNYTREYKYIPSAYNNRIVEKEKVEKFVKCKRCANSFMLDELKPICPFCYEEIKIYNKEVEVENQSLQDSNPRGESGKSQLC